MKSCLLVVVGVVGGFIVLAFMSPQVPQPEPELCQDGKDLMAMAGATREQAQKMGCDRQAQREAFDALYAKQHGR